MSSNRELSSIIKKKICLLGSFAVGKTSLIDRFVYNRFDEKYITTIGVKVSQKILPPVQPPQKDQFVQYTFLIWDISSMEKFDTVVTNYFRGAAAALGVADLTRTDTLPRLHGICDKFRSVSPNAQILVLGNKLDIFNQDDQTLGLLKNIAADFSTEYLLTSAKTGDQVEDAFLMLAKKMAAT